jgi:chaperone BCS1
MTSNTPESLDHALVRPGRIDRQFLFGYINQTVAENVFLRMYQDDSKKDPETTAESAGITEMAKQFALKIPDYKLTPAEVQGFLIPLSEQPDLALESIGNFVDE